MNIKEKLESLTFYGKKITQMNQLETQLLMSDLLLVSVMDKINSIEGHTDELVQLGMVMGKLVCDRYEMTSIILGMEERPQRDVIEKTEGGVYSLEKFKKDFKKSYEKNGKMFENQFEKQYSSVVPFQMSLN